jgi:uncharacterized protein YaiL (DUF2058 family)
MANSLGDQFLKAGLVSKDQVHKAKKSKHKQKKQNSAAVNEAAVAAQKAVEEKAARDRELNRQRKEELERKAIHAQVRQLIEMNRLPRDEGDIGYNFQDGTAIKKLFVTQEIHRSLSLGRLAVARLDEGYEVIPAIVAEKIMQRETECIVSNASRPQESNDDDPYADYQVPEDLMW